METKFRSIIKTISYRFVNTFVTLLVTLIVFNTETSVAGSMALVQLIVGSLVYFIYDRIWTSVKWHVEKSEDVVLYESKFRSFLKTIGYRLIVLILGMLMARSIMTSDNIIAIYWSLMSNFISLIIYYLHERCWNLIKQGKILDEDNQ